MRPSSCISFRRPSSFHSGETDSFFSSGGVIVFIVESEIARVILAFPGIERTELSLSMRETVPSRTALLLRELAGLTEG